MGAEGPSLSERSKFQKGFWVASIVGVSGAAAVAESTGILYCQGDSSGDLAIKKGSAINQSPAARLTADIYGRWSLLKCLTTGVPPWYRSDSTFVSACRRSQKNPSKACGLSEH